MNRPQSLTELFVEFTRLALQGFGGVLAIAQRELLTKVGTVNSNHDNGQSVVGHFMRTS